MPQLLVWSAIDTPAVQRMASSYGQRFATSSGKAGPQLDLYWKSLAYTLDTRRTAWNWRSFIVADSLSQLSNLEKNISVPVKATVKPKLAFAFTGQGAQWPRMGNDLLDHFPVFRNSLAESEEILEQLGCSWSLVGM